MVTPQLLTDHPEVAGAILVAGTPRSLFDVWYDQIFEQISADPDTAEQEKQDLIAQAWG